MLGLRRVQEGLKWRQELLSQNNRLLQSLRVELKVYEKLDSQHGIPRGTGTGAGLSLPGRWVLGCHHTQSSPGWQVYFKASSVAHSSSEEAAGLTEGGSPGVSWRLDFHRLAPSSVALGSSSHPLGPVSSSVERAH